MMPADLAHHRLVYVAPALGRTAVGDYGNGFVEAVRPHFGEVVEVRTLGPGEDGVADIRRYRDTVKALVAGGPPGRVLVHSEIAAGGVGPFWSTTGLEDVPVTSTIHDPPQGVWMPARTRFIAKSKMRTHAIHYPLRPVSRMIEGSVYGDRTLFALTDTGRRAIERTYPRANVHFAPYLISERPEIKPVAQRPKAVGFFGMVYRGKGFEHIAAIREQLPDDILIRVAGRGTESLPRIEGVEIIGSVDGPDEDAFFESVRAIVVPYCKRHFYAETYPASAVVAHSTAYRTPVVCTDYGALADLDESSGVLVVRADRAQSEPLPAKFGSTIASLVNDSQRLAGLERASDLTRRRHGAAGTGAAFAAVWSEMLGRQGQAALQSPRRAYVAGPLQRR
jgi:hypothetical protein